jgi:type I restriction enzyme M protein
MNSSSLVQKLWNFCHTLRDDGVGYGDYLEQLTYLLFLKLAHEYAQEPYNRDTRIPKGYDWASLRSKVGEPLEAHYLVTLHRLGQEQGMLGAIFFKAQNKIQDPAKLSRLVQLIDAENWISLDVDTRATCAKACCRRTRKTPRAVRGSISPLAR